jgi:hypothetical protein
MQVRTHTYVDDEPQKLFGTATRVEYMTVPQADFLLSDSGTLMGRIEAHVIEPMGGPILMFRAIPINAYHRATECFTHEDAAHYLIQVHRGVL